MADAHVRRQAATMRRVVSWESRARYLIQALACACVCVMPTRTVQGGAAAAGAAAATDIEPDTAALLTWLRAEGAQLDGISIGPGAKDATVTLHIYDCASPAPPRHPSLRSTLVWLANAR